MAMSKLSTQHSEQSPLLQRAESRLSSPSFVPIDIAPVPESISACSSKHSGSKNSSCKHGSSCSLASADGSGNIGTCRICLEQETVDSQDPNNPLISPCHCSGGSKFVHRHCLQQWRQTAHRADAYYQCEVCKYRYRYRRLWWAHILGSQATLTVMFLLAMTACITVLGFIPVTNSFFAKSSSGSSSSPSSAPSGDSGSTSSSSSVSIVTIHIANGIILMGILGLLLSIMVHLGRAFGPSAFALFPDPWCPSCMVCMQEGGLGWAPFIECGSAGECGVALLAVVAVVMLMLGVVMAAYMLYGMLWMLVRAGLNRAQHMVENVQQDEQQATKD